MERIDFREEINKNKLRSFFLLVSIIAFAIFTGYIIGEIYNPSIATFFVIFAFTIALIQILYTYNYGDKIVLSVTKARPINERDIKEKHFQNLVEGLSISAGIPTPKAYIIDSNDMNAFACGKDPEHASIVATKGLIENLNRAEIEGVIGHEMAHIKNYDIKFATLVAVAAGFISILSWMITRNMYFNINRKDEKRGGNAIILILGFLLLIIAPIIAKLVQLAISRKREYLADAYSVKLTRYPKGLANALYKIKNHSAQKLEVPEAVSHLFFVNPFKKENIENLFSTHPPIDKRIEILNKM